MVTGDGGALARPCEGCGAVPGEPCREWCLSHVTGPDGDPVDTGECRCDSIEYVCAACADYATRTEGG